MNQILSNLAYFNISKLNPEPLLDENYIFVEIDKNIEKYIENNRQIKNILITIRTLQINDEEQKVIDKYFLELSKIISKFSNCSEFSCFVNACDNIIFETKNELFNFKNIRDFAKKALYSVDTNINESEIIVPEFIFFDLCFTNKLSECLLDNCNVRFEVQDIIDEYILFPQVENNHEQINSVKNMCLMNDKIRNAIKKSKKSENSYKNAKFIVSTYDENLKTYMLEEIGHKSLSVLFQ